MIYPPLTRLSNREIARETTWSSRMTAAQSAEIFEKLKASVTPAL
jgi:hypothetical protein